MGKQGVEVEELFELEKELPYRVEIGWGRHGEDGSYEVLLRRRSASGDKSEEEIKTVGLSGRESDAGEGVAGVRE